MDQSIHKSMEDIRQNDGPPVHAGDVANYGESIPWSPYKSARPGSQSQGPAQWSTGLCDCSEDCDNCLLTFCCPCITFGRIAESLDHGSSSCGMSAALYLLIALTGCQCLYSCTYRKKLRVHYALPESPCNDCLVHCCCEACALCQAYRELENRDFDMTLGSHEILETKGVEMIQPAPMQGAMTR